MYYNWTFYEQKEKDAKKFYKFESNLKWERFILNWMKRATWFDKIVLSTFLSF